VTDRLSNHTGFESFFKDGEDLVMYDTMKDLCEKLDYYLEHPRLCLEIAQNGKKKYMDNFHPELQINRVLSAAFDRENPLSYSSSYIVTDKRSCYMKTSNEEYFMKRVGIYEYFQECNKNSESFKVLFTGDVDPKIICDISDLQRISINIIADEQYSDAKELFEKIHIMDKINFVNEEFVKKNSWDLIVSDKPLR
jgi:hypothetical protein